MVEFLDTYIGFVVILLFLAGWIFKLLPLDDDPLIEAAKTAINPEPKMNIKAFFSPPSARELAIKERKEAERLLLEAQTAKEFATQMEVYHAGRVKRLDAYLKTFESDFTTVTHTI